MAIAIKNQAGSAVDFVKESLAFEDTVTQRGTLQFQEIGSPPSLAWGEDVSVYDDGGSPLYYAGDLPIELAGGGFLELAQKTIYWGGTVESIAEDDITVGDTTTIRFTYRCVDFSELAGRLLLQTETTEQSCGAWIRSRVGAGTSLTSYYGVTEGDIDDGAYVEYMPWNYVSHELAFDELAEISGFYWNIDKEKKLHFRSVNDKPAPFSITSSNRPYKNINFQTIRGAFCNQVFVRAGTNIEEDNTVEVQVGDGSKRVFVVGAQIGDLASIEVDTGGGYSSQTVAVDGVGEIAQWYYSGNYVLHDEDETVLSASDKVRITYKASVPIIVSATADEALVERSAAEAATYALYQRVVDATDIDNAAAAELKAQSILSQFSQARITCRYQTDRVNLEAGQSQYINLPEHGIDATFLIEKISASLRHDGQLSFTVNAAATQTVAGWSYWKQKTRQDRKFVKRTNEVLRLLNKESDAVTISDSAAGATTTASGFLVGAATAIIGLVDVG